MPATEWYVYLGHALPKEAAENAEKGWRKILTLPWLLFVTVLTAIASTGVAYIATNVEESSTEADPVKVAVETNPAKVGAFSDMRQGMVIPLVKEVHDSPGEGCGNFHDWARAKHGVDADATRMQITVQGRAAGETLISKMRVIIVQRLAPIKGLTVECPSAGSVSLRLLAVDLDQRNPQLEYAGKRPFGFTIAAGETETFIVTALASKAHYLWRIEMDVVAGETKSVIQVDDNGKPFETTPGTKGLWSWNYENAWALRNGLERVVSGKSVTTKSTP
ncbi:hypothetical protein J5X84_39345 [Streptosporangiaceae bacterium NEAU-GS5]|nr:hypothetical protein [Streptosporangiaceae bacterium NEAU-GS5]